MPVALRRGPKSFKEVKLGSQLDGRGVAVRWWPRGVAGSEWGTWHTANLYTLNLGRLEVMFVCPR